MILRTFSSQWSPFVSALCARIDVETAGLILAETLGSGNDVLLARQMIEIPPDGYLIRRGDQIRIDPVTLNRLIRPAREASMSVITVHTHPGTKEPWFSAADDRGDGRLIPSFFYQSHGPHGSMVLAGESRHPAGRVWSKNKTKLTLQTRIVGKTLRLHPQPPNQLDTAWFDRQRLALGEEGQAILRNLHVVIVGLGGIGSVAFVQLAHLGVGRITAVDGDRVEQSNVSRILGATVQDAGRAWKVDVAARYAERLGLDTQVRCLRGHLGSDVGAAEIEECDVSFSCVDKHLPRAVLNRLAYEKAVPLIDLGTAFRVDGENHVTDGVGRVVVVGPDRPCLACWGHVDPNRIRIEALPVADRAREEADGYIDGADISQPSVVAFNTMVAGAGVVEFLRLVTGFAGTEDAPMRLSFDFVTGTVRRNRLSSRLGCKICLQGS